MDTVPKHCHVEFMQRGQGCFERFVCRVWMNGQFLRCFAWQTSSS